MRAMPSDRRPFMPHRARVQAVTVLLGLGLVGLGCTTANSPSAPAAPATAASPVENAAPSPTPSPTGGTVIPSITL